MARVVVVSFRLGGTDGVSVEAAKWIAALRHLGRTVTTLAGAGDADHLLPSLAIGADPAPSSEELRRALSGADVVIVENLASLPLNVNARDALYDALSGRRAIFRHHDLAWQRTTWQASDVPRCGEHWTHVTINERSRRELLEYNVPATRLYNRFDCDPPLGRRDHTRELLGLGDERLVLMPSRALERKNVPGALAFAAALSATLWLLGPAEDGYGATLEALLAATTLPVLLGCPPGIDIHDAYGACDVVVVPSTWEGFGNPVLESVTHRRPLAVYPYPVLHELRDFGFHFFDLADVEGVTGLLERPSTGYFDANVAIARQHFNAKDLPTELSELLARSGIDVAN